MSGALPPLAVHALVGCSGTVLPSLHVLIIIMERVGSAGEKFRYPTEDAKKYKIRQSSSYILS
jgi:hypothetical protein